MEHARIVIGIPGDDAVDMGPALAEAGAWATRRHLDIKLVHGLGLLPVMAESELIRRDNRSPSARRRLRWAAHELGLRTDSDIRVSTEVSPLPATALLLRESEQADLLVLERRNLGRVARVWEGSTSGLVAAGSHCPVLITRTGHRRVSDQEPHGVLVAVDDRGHCEEAIARAFEEASWRGVPLTAVHAWGAEVFGYPGYLPPDRNEIEEVRREAGRLTSIALAGYGELYPEVTVINHLDRQMIVDALLAQAAKSDLLVLARHDNHRGVWTGLGSVARKMLDSAPCPVLITPSRRPVADASRRRRMATA